MIKVILFDFAGVVGAEGYWIWLKEKVPDLESKRPYFQSLSEKIDRAEITNQEFIKAVAKGVNVSTEIVWKEIFKKIVINTELLNLISQLKKKYKIGLLTNYNYEWMNELFTIYDLDKYFDEKIISSLHKTIKPDPKIYKITLNIFKIKPAEAIFIDDRQSNVDGGKNVGIKSFLFTTNSKLMEDLENNI
ncbi:MAG: HAD-IA family hydrolase [Candidatus Roizmanbacteria bacterium]